MSAVSIHPAAVAWHPDPAPTTSTGRTTAWSSRLGFVFMTVTGKWQASTHQNDDCGEHATRKNAQQAVENFKP